MLAGLSAEQHGHPHFAAAPLMHRPVLPSCHSSSAWSIPVQVLDLAPQLYPEPIAHPRLRRRDQRSHVGRRRRAVVDDPVGVLGRERRAADGEPLQPALLEQTPREIAGRIGERRTRAGAGRLRLLAERGMLVGEPHQCGGIAFRQQHDRRQHRPRSWPRRRLDDRVPVGRLQPRRRTLLDLAPLVQDDHRFEVVVLLGSVRSGVVDRGAADRPRQPDAPVHPGPAAFRGVAAGPGQRRLRRHPQPDGVAQVLRLDQLAARSPGVRARITSPRIPSSPTRRLLPPPMTVTGSPSCRPQATAATRSSGVAARTRKSAGPPMRQVVCKRIGASRSTFSPGEPGIVNASAPAARPRGRGRS